MLRGVAAPLPAVAAGAALTPGATAAVAAGLAAGVAMLSEAASLRQDVGASTLAAANAASEAARSFAIAAGESAASVQLATQQVLAPPFEPSARSPGSRPTGRLHEACTSFSVRPLARRYAHW